MNDDTRKLPPPEPLPREWLPEAYPEGGPWFEFRVELTVGALQPGLEALAGKAPVEAVPWWSIMGNWWQPAGAVAAAAAVLLFLVDRPAPPSGSSADSLTLGLIAAEGDPAALWGAMGVAADPVLAHVVFADHGVGMEPAAPGPPTEGGAR